MYYRGQVDILLREEINWAIAVDIGEFVSLRVKKQLGSIV